MNAMQIESRQWLKFVLYVLVLSVLMFGWQSAFATDGTEFADAAGKFEEWVTGNLGKLASLVAVAVGSVVAAVRKDWSWFFGAVVLAIGINIVLSIIDASFTATI